MALTRTEVARALFDRLGLNKREAREVVDLFFEEICGALGSGERVDLRGFGAFELRNKNSRRGRNPSTGEEVPISARRVVTFRPGSRLRIRSAAHAGAKDRIFAQLLELSPARR